MGCNVGNEYIINNMLPILLMEKNISSFILLLLLWAGGGMECYKIKVIQDVGEKYKKMVILMICRQKKKNCTEE